MDLDGIGNPIGGQFMQRTVNFTPNRFDSVRYSGFTCGLKFLNLLFTFYNIKNTANVQLYYILPSLFYTILIKVEIKMKNTLKIF